MLTLHPIHSKLLVVTVFAATIVITLGSSFNPRGLRSKFLPIHHGRMSYSAFLSVYEKMDTEILDAYGKPDNEEPAIRMEGDCWPAAKEADFNWLYCLNDEYTLVLSFRNHRCFSVLLSDYYDHLRYQHWKARLIGSLAQGNTPENIREHFGEPTSKSGPITLEGWSKEAREADEVWNYDTGYSTCEMLTFKNGRCTSVKELAIFH